MKLKALLIALAIATPLLVTAPVAAKGASFPLAPGGSCNKFRGFTGPEEGSVSIKTEGKAGIKTKYQVKIDAEGLTPDQTLEVWMADLNVKNGLVKGCSSSKVATVKVDKKGHLHKDGKVEETTNTLPKQVFIVKSFTSPGLVTDVLYL